MLNVLWLYTKYVSAHGYVYVYVFMCMCMFVCMFVCMCMFVYVYVCVYVHVCACPRKCTNSTIFLFTHMCSVHCVCVEIIQ